MAGQIGRSARINLGYRHDSRYVGLEAFKNNKGIIGFDFLMKGTQYFDPLNTPRFMNPTRDFIAVCTNCKTGRPEYFSKNKNCRIFLKLYKPVQPCLMFQRWLKLKMVYI